MCGIVGYIGNKKATPVLINGLLSLEYRGYDSAGIAVIENNEICVLKDKGRVANLRKIPEIDTLESSIGIAHTRWATHGKPSKANSHPHLDNSKQFAVVHNGIIENYNELKEFLCSKGYKFLSQTDTEVIPNLIHYYYTNGISDDDKFLTAVKSAIDDLKGSYAIEVISNLYPDRVIVVRKDSPLVIGTSKEENFISSDIPAILSYTKNFYLLDDYEYAVVYNDHIQFFDIDRLFLLYMARALDNFERLGINLKNEEKTNISDTNLMSDSVSTGKNVDISELLELMGEFNEGIKRIISSKMIPYSLEVKLINDGEETKSYTLSDVIALSKNFCGNIYLNENMKEFSIYQLYENIPEFWENSELFKRLDLREQDYLYFAASIEIISN